MRLLITRPEAGPEGDPLAAALTAMGHAVVQAPMLSVSYTDTVPNLAGAQALIATSRNGLKAFIRRGLPSEAVLALPLLAVGPATAAFGREIGFRTVVEGAGTGRELLAQIKSDIDPAAGVLVHLSGETLAVDLKGALEAAGFHVRREIVYQTHAASGFPDEVTAKLRAGLLDGVVLMSPRTAKVYAGLITELGLADSVRRLVHFCLSDAVGRALARLEPVNFAVARSPNSQEMLALIAHEASESF